MNKKRILVLVIALVLFTLVAGVVFAASEMKGVIWVKINGRSSELRDQTASNYTEIYNDNNYAVKVRISRAHTKNGDDNEPVFAAKQTRHYNGSVTVISVTPIK